MGAYETQLVAITEIVEDILQQALGLTYRPGLLDGDVPNWLEAVFVGKYAAKDVVRLISYSLICCLHEQGKLLNYLDIRVTTEAALLKCITTE